MLYVVVAMIVLYLALVIGRWDRSRTAKRRAARAMAGEGDAVALLESAGYTVVERQAIVAWAPLVDGQPIDTPLRADYLVERAGKLLVAEVKTGEAAPSITTAATRRQLLEYSIAFAADGVLLVCPESGQIHEVVFPSGRYT
ncbi:MAG: hypothetical protein QM831_30430 [Kofleriaceae bacterium]